MAASDYKDYFSILGVERNANAETIKRAFRKLARKFHPDVNPGDSKAESKFKEINEAYEVLSDPDKRKRYEQFGQYWSQVGGNRGSTNAGFDVDFGSYGNFDEFINDLLGRFAGSNVGAGFAGGAGFPRSDSRPTLNLDAEVLVKVSFAEAFQGTERTLSVNEEKVQVLIPRGVKPGTKLRLKGKGNIQPGTGRRGDLYLILQLQPHEIWKLEGNQLKADMPVTFDELLLGGSIELVTPDGSAEVYIPAGTPPGKCLRLRNKGWPSKDGRGDLFLTLTLKFSEKYSEEEVQLLKELHRIRSIDPRKSWIQSALL